MAFEAENPLGVTARMLNICRVGSLAMGFAFQAFAWNVEVFPKSFGLKLGTPVDWQARHAGSQLLANVFTWLLAAAIMLLLSLSWLNQ